LLPLLGPGSVGLVPLDQLIVRRHDVLGPGKVRLVHTLTIVDIFVIAWRLISQHLLLVHSVSMFPRVGHVLREVVVGGAILLQQLPVLELDGVIVLPGHVIVDFVRVLRDVPDRLNLHSDSSVKPGLMIRLDKDMLFSVNQLLGTLLPSLLVSPSPRSDPLTPVQPLEPCHHGWETLSFSIFHVIQRDAMPILGHLLPRVKRIPAVDGLQSVLRALIVFRTARIRVHELGELPDHGADGGQELEERRHVVGGGEEGGT